MLKAVQLRQIYNLHWQKVLATATQSVWELQGLTAIEMIIN